MDKFFPSDYGVAPVSIAPTGQPAMESGPLTDIHGTIAGEQQVMTDAEVDAALPKAVGYKILIALPEVEKTFSGTRIEKVDTTIAAETITTVIGLVLDIGPDAYQDKNRFPSGPWCKVGDYVLVRPYQGTRFICNNQEFRMIFDDHVDGVVADPSSYRRI